MLSANKRWVIMDRLDKKNDREMRKLDRAEKKKSVLEWLSNGVARIGDKVEGFGFAIKDNVCEYLEEKRKERDFQEGCQDAFDDYLDMHDENRIGMCNIYSLTNGGLRVVIHTEHGPIIKTIETTGEYELIDLKKISQDFYFENKRSYKISYEGYCSYVSDGDGVSGVKRGERRYYASVTCELPSIKDTFGAPIAMYYGVERKNNGKFRKVRFVQSGTEQIPEIYTDLKRTFAKQWGLMCAKNNDGNNNGIIQGRFGVNKLFTLDR